MTTSEILQAISVLQKEREYWESQPWAVAREAVPALNLKITRLLSLLQ